MRLTAIVAPAPERPLHPTEVTPRIFDHVDEFAAALSLAAGRPVPVVEGSLVDAPAEGFLVFFRPSPIGDLEIPAALGPRVVLVNATRGSVRKELETYRLAAAIGEGRYVDWHGDRARETSRGLLARRDVAEQIGGVMVSTLYRTEHYGEFSHPGHKTLPEFLVAYLAALEEG